MTFKTYVPFSEGKYYLDQNNHLYDCESNVIPTINNNGNLFVKLDWVNGQTIYNLVILIIITRFNVKIPVQLWDEIQPLFKNRNNSDLSTSNLTYTFKNKPLEVPNKPGFYYIPFYTNYCIDKYGNVFSFLKKKIKKWYISKPNANKNIKGGYFIGRAIKDFGTGTHIGRHRLVLLAFAEYDETIDSLVCNHKNGIPGDDKLDNLEFITKAQNNQHAYDNGLSNSLVPIRVKNTHTGYEALFNSITKCCKVLNFTYGFIYGRLSKNKQYDDGWLFKLEDGRDWPVLEDKIHKSSTLRSIVCRNIFTGQLSIFESAVEASRAVGCSQVTILNHCNQKQMMPINGFNFRFTNDAYNWPNYSKEHLKIFSSNPRCINKKVLIEVIERTLKVPLSSN